MGEIQMTKGKEREGIAIIGESRREDTKKKGLE